MHIGFTGTGSRPLTRAQRYYLELELKLRCPNRVQIGDQGYLHLGDCIHADAECHQIATSLTDPILMRSSWITVGHIPDKDSKRAFCKYDIELPRKPYIDRNHDIVDQTALLIACPGMMAEEVSYSGTWATIRYALKKAKPVLIIWPNGKVEDGWEFYNREGKLESVRVAHHQATIHAQRFFKENCRKWRGSYNDL